MQSAAIVVSAITGAAVTAAIFTLFQKRHRNIQIDAQRKLWTAEELVASRRSIYPETYDVRHQVPREIVEKMLEGANWAPTHARTEPWRFVVFSTLEARRKLGEFDAELYKKNTSVDKFVQKKFDKKIKSKLQSSHVIAICMKRQESEKLPEFEEICAVACAVQNMHLIATAHNVGAYWSTGAVCSSEMNEFLGVLGPKDKCIGLFYIGYPSKEHPQGARKPIADKVTWK